MKEKAFPCFDRLEKIIGEKNFLLDYVSYADFFVYHAVDFAVSGFEGTNVLENFPNL